MSLRFLSKVAFICNIFFLLALILRYRQFIEQQDINSHIILLGWLIAPLVNIVFLIGWIVQKKQQRPFSLWLGLVNIFFLMVQTYLFFILR